MEQATPFDGLMFRLSHAPDNLPDPQTSP